MLLGRVPGPAARVAPDRRCRAGSHTVTGRAVGGIGLGSVVEPAR